MKTELSVLLIPLSQIIVPDFVVRDPSPEADATLKRSIEQGGMQQPLVVLSDGEVLKLIDGTRRLAIARSLGMPKVACVIESLPASEPDADSYIRRLRFVLDEHRQDLLVTQRAQLVKKVKEDFKFTHEKLAAFLGVDMDSITGWLAVLRYIPPVQRALDASYITAKAARVFDGLTEEGQGFIWNRHMDDIAGLGKSEIGKEMRKKYPPAKYPSFYTNAKLSASRQKSGGKRKTQRPSFTDDEKRRLLKSVDVKESEIELLRVEERENKAEIQAAAPIIAAMLRNPKLRALLPADMLPELERFGEVYC